MRKVAILPWGNLIEDFLDTIGVSLESFAREMSGGWLFGYADALREAQIDSCLICVSGRVPRAMRVVNPATGLATLVLPAGRTYLAARRRLGDPDDAGGGRGGLSGKAQRVVPYLATPRRTLAQALRDEACSDLLCQEYEYARFDVASAVARREGLGVFASFQGGIAAAGGVGQAVRRAAVRRADGLIAAAGDEVARVRSTYGLPAERVAQIPNPVEVDVWRPVDRAEARAALGLPGTALVAICHCRIDYRRKGLDLLMAAWRRVTAARPGADLRLHLVGSGADDAVLEADVARLPVPGLRWLRSYTQDRVLMRRELSAADLYVLASRHEGFPVAPLEAMACGLPAVLADMPGAREILQGGEASGGLVVPREDPAALAAAIGRLIDDAALRARLAAAARPRVESFASTSAVGRQLAAFIEARSPRRCASGAGR